MVLVIKDVQYCENGDGYMYKGSVINYWYIFF